VYKIVGADQNIYGPVTAEQMRQWIVQGRVNAQTLVQAEGSSDWKPLAAYPEFGSLARTMAPLPSRSGGRAAALQAVNAPAIWLRATAILNAILAIFGLSMNILKLAGVDTGMSGIEETEMSKVFSAAGGWMEIAADFVCITVSVLIFIGASKMKALENRPYAVAASVLSLLPCVSPCCIVGIPIGIWALVVLNRAEVKSQFT
jgi:GYF domain 2